MYINNRFDQLNVKPIEFGVGAQIQDSKLPILSFELKQFGSVVSTYDYWLHFYDLKQQNQPTKQKDNFIQMQKKNYPTLVLTLVQPVEMLNKIDDLCDMASYYTVEMIKMNQDFQHEEPVPMKTEKMKKMGS